MNGRRRSGYSMVELAMVCTVMLILASAAFPVARYSVRRQAELELRYQLRKMRNSIDDFKQKSDAGLIPVELGTEGYPGEIEILVEGVELVGHVKAKQRWLRRIPRDPMTGDFEWGLRSYQDEPDATSWGGQNVYDVYSLSDATALDGTSYSEW